MLNCIYPQILCRNFPKTVGRPSPGILGIVIHTIEEDYQAAASAQAATGDLAGNSEHGYHFFIGSLGNVLQTESIENWLPNLYFSFSPSVNWIPGYNSTSNPNADADPYVIHIALASINQQNVYPVCHRVGMTQPQYEALVNLICCINTWLITPITVDDDHVVTPDKILYNVENLAKYRDFVLPPSLFVDASTEGCAIRAAEAGVVGVPPDVPLVPVPVLVPACCDVNALDIIALTNIVNALTLQVNSLITVVNTSVPLAQAAYDEAIATKIYLASIKNCLDCLCPSDISHGRIEYQIINEVDKQIILPNVNRWINFATKITDLVPHRVQPGPLWTVALDTGVYPASVSLRLAPSDYCVGCKVWLEVTICGITTRIEQLVILTAGIQTVTLNWSGNLTVVGNCNDIHFSIGTDSTLGTPPYKILECATVIIDVV